MIHQLLVDESFDHVISGDVFETYWAANDHLGSVGQLVDNTGTVVEHREFDSFGAIDQVFDETGTEKESRSIKSDVAHTGRFWDEDAGLYQNRARWYDPHTGRFVSEDPIGFADGPNLYPYAGSDPINTIDPTGESQAGNPLNSLAGGFSGNVLQQENRRLRDINFGPISPTFNFNFDTAQQVLNQPTFTPSSVNTISTGLSLSSIDTTSSLLRPNFSELASRRSTSNLDLELSSFNTLSSVNNRSAVFDQIAFDAIANPAPKRIASVRQIGSGGPGVGFLKESQALQRHADLAAGKGNTFDAIVLQLGATSNNFVGSLLQSIGENTPSTEITFEDGSRELRLSGELTSGAAANSALVFGAPLFSTTGVATQTTANTTRQRVLANIAESQNARQASNIGGELTTQSAKISRQNAARLLVNRGANNQQAANVINSFDDSITISRGATGQRFVVTETSPGSASGLFVTRTSAGATPAERIRRLALPLSNTVQFESNVFLTRPQLLLEGPVAPQVGNPGFGPAATGGFNQIITDAFNGGLRRP